MARTAAWAALAASAMLLLGGCQGNHRAVVQTPPAPSSALSSAPSPSPADIEATKTKACHSFVISAKAMSDSQQAFTERHPFIEWGNKQVKG